MRIPKAPNWPNIIISGFIGGWVSWALDHRFPGIGLWSDVAGFVVFCLMLAGSAILAGSAKNSEK